MKGYQIGCSVIDLSKPNSTAAQSCPKLAKEAHLIQLILLHNHEAVIDLSEPNSTNTAAHLAHESIIDLSEPNSTAAQSELG